MRAHHDDLVLLHGIGAGDLGDGVVGVRLEHGGQVALLQVPDAVVRQDGFDLAREFDRLIEIVEHGDRGDDPGLLVLFEGAIGLGRKEVGKQLDVVGVERLEFPGRGINADPLQAAGAVGLERCGVRPTVRR